MRFTVHDLSTVAPPKVTKPGSETEQEQLIEDVVRLVVAQRAASARIDRCAHPYRNT